MVSHVSDGYIDNEEWCIEPLNPIFILVTGPTLLQVPKTPWRALYEHCGPFGIKPIIPMDTHNPAIPAHTQESHGLFLSANWGPIPL